MIVATASSCLKSAKLLFRVLEITELNTSLGYVHIIEVIEPGTLVVAGPTTNHDLNVLVAKMGTYAEKIFVDGAFNRITFANIKNMDGIVLTTGASVHPDMMKTIEKTKRVVESFSLKQTPIFKKLPDFKMMIQTPNTTLQFTNKKSETLKTALMGLNESVSTIYIQGAITPRHIQVFIECATQRFTLISDDPTKYLISEHYFSYLEKLETRLQIIFPCPLLFITINPFCPKGHHYEPIIFLSEMKKAIKIPIYNVKEMEW
ncbi:MAG: hypothetical protein IH571_01355 [Acholeplasmataceae bacterium]|nr:hypothetical protein [Acholeplasmataceae bacterium]